MKTFLKRQSVRALIVCGLLAIATPGRAEITVIAEKLDAPPEGNGIFSGFSDNTMVLNEIGQVAFVAYLTGTSGGTDDNLGLYYGSGGPLTTVVREGTAAPDGNGVIEAMGVPALNNAGQVAFNAWMRDTSGGTLDDVCVLLASGGTVTQIAREGIAPPEGNGEFFIPGNPNLNNAGQVAFRGLLRDTSGGTSDDEGIYVGSASGLNTIAREGEPAHDSDGVFSLLVDDPAINDLGQVAFMGYYTGNSGGVADNQIVLRGSSNDDLISIAREGDPAPGGSGTLASPWRPALNDVGQAAVRIALTGTPGGLDDNERLYRGSGGALTEIAREGDLTPSSNGVFDNFGFDSVDVNNAGQLAFYAGLRNTAGGTADDTGLFLGSGGAVTEFAREGDTAPDGNGTFSTFDDTTGGALNDVGHIAFHTSINGTSGGSDDNAGVYISDGVETVRVARKGQAMLGSTVTSVAFVAGRRDESNERSGLNDRGQVAVAIVLADGKSLVARFTPDLHWREAGSGNWSTDNNWTLGIAPDALYDVFIDPAGSASVTGRSTNQTVKSLTIGSTGGGLAALQLTKGDLTSLGNVTINADGRIDVPSGQILSAPTIDNSGVLTGGGTIDATLENQISGEVRVAAGNALHMAENNLQTNAGTVQVLGGTPIAGGFAEIEFDGEVRNAISTGLITASGGSLLRFNGGLGNYGSLGFSFATSSVFGDVTNQGAGNITVSGGSNVTFYGDVINSGTVTTTTGSTTVFFGDLSGAGSFPGGGTVYADGDLRPGASPASVAFGGNLVLGPFTQTHVELGGTSAGAEHDQLDVTGDLTLGGTLNVSLINAGGGLLIPQAGNFFDILNFNTISGDFTKMDLPKIDPSLMWNVGFLKTTGELLSTFMGDINGDVMVGVTDLGMLANQWGTPGFGQFNADITGDGIVSVTDLGALAANWGAAVGPSLSGADAVPVPSAALAGGVVCAILGLRRRRVA